MQNIPSVDLRDFLSGDPERKQKFVNEIGKARRYWLRSIKGHFLDDKLVDELYSEVRNFFNLPLETKAKYEIPGIGGQRGYVSFGKEHAKTLCWRLERVLAFWAICGCRFKIRFRISGQRNGRRITKVQCCG
jgi:isopenicillin N synthase-like dioxygenase